MKKLHLLCRVPLSIALLFTAATTYAQQWRLIEIVNQTDTPATSTSSYLTMDSTRYIYSTTVARGSSPNNDTINFDEMLVFNRDANSLLPSEKRTRAYNSTNNLWATAHFRYDKANSNWGIQSWDTLFYNGSQLYRMSTYNNLGSSTLETSRDSFVYDTKGNVAFKENSVSMGVGSPLSPLLWNFYQYDANNNLTIDSALLYLNGWWETQYVIKRSLNTAGNVVDYRIYSPLSGIGGPLDLMYRKYHYYDANGRLTLDSLQTYYQPTLSRDHEENRYTYNGSGQMVSTTYWKRDKTTLQTVDSQEITYTYTSFGRVATREVVFYNAGGGISKKEKRIYTYEQYFPVSVTTLTADNDAIQLYPNPTQNVLNVVWKDKPNSAIEGRVINTQGQVVQQWIMEDDHKVINTSTLPEGNYYIELVGKTDKIHKQFAVIK